MPKPHHALVASAVAAVALVAACPADKPAATPDAGSAPLASAADAGVAPATPPPAANPPPGEPEQPEPAGITAGGKAVPAAPSGKGTWAVDPKATDVSFTIVSNSAGPITGRFPEGAAGAFDPKKKSGVFTVDITKMVSVNKDNAGNPVRDTNVIESFFGARPFANATLAGKVDEAWKALDGKIKRGVATAALVVDSVEGAAATGKGDGVVNGKLILWESVEVPVSFPVTATQTKDSVEIKGTAPAKMNISAAVGTPLRKALFDTMLAAGCAHQPGIQSDVSVSFDRITLKKQ